MRPPQRHYLPWWMGSSGHCCPPSSEARCCQIRCRYAFFSSVACRRAGPELGGVFSRTIDTVVVSANALVGEHDDASGLPLGIACNLNTKSNVNAKANLG